MLRKGRGDEGASQALDQVANWVRFADTKATVLTAALGVVLTLLLSNAPAVLKAARTGEVPAIVLGCAAVLAGVSFVCTLVSLVRALMPRRSAEGPVNRFSWPLLAEASAQELADHLADVDAATDAWAQARVLAATAKTKFDHCADAVVWFTIFIIIVVALAVATVFLTFP